MQIKLAVVGWTLALCVLGCGSSDAKGSAFPANSPVSVAGIGGGVPNGGPPPGNGATAGKGGATPPNTGATGGTRPTGTSGMTGAAGMTPPKPGTGGTTPPAGTGGAMPAGSAGSNPPPATGNGMPRIPMPTEACPQLKTGTVKVLGHDVQMWVGAKSADKTGPVLFYWHGTGSTSAEASLLGAAVQEIQKLGGIIASFTDSTAQGMTTGNNVWYTGDYVLADEVLACAVQQLNIDVRRIYTAGCSAGGLQAGSMLYGRSSYIAASMPNSGGVTFGQTLEDKSHVPAVITAHGDDGDFSGLFKTASETETKDVASKGGFAVDCDHAGGHCQAPPELVAAQWQFLKDHPFGVTPEPYSTLPMTFPSYCKIIGK